MKNKSRLSVKMAGQRHLLLALTNVSRTLASTICLESFQSVRGSMRNCRCPRASKKMLTCLISSKMCLAQHMLLWAQLIKKWKASGETLMEIYSRIQLGVTVANPVMVMGLNITFNIEHGISQNGMMSVDEL